MDRFWSKVSITDGCWLWTASLTDSGYGRFNTGEYETTAHRFAWMLTHGPIVGENMEVDHFDCKNRHCVRLEHLRLVTKKENLATRVHRNTKKTHCIRGHALIGANVWEPPSQPGARKCRTCNREKARRRREAQRP